MPKPLLQNREPILQLQNVNKDFNRLPVLRKVNLLLNSGELIYIVGENGSGKSTLLNLISHDDVPDTGIIQVGNYRLDQLTKKDMPYFRRTIGYMHQTPDLIPEMTVKDNLMYPLHALGYDEETVRHRYEDILALTGLYDLRNSKVSHDNHFLLSGGQLQMVSIAQALVNQPEILLCDEPTGNLDSEKSDYVINFLENVTKMNTAVVIVTHDNNLVYNHPHTTYSLDPQTHTLIKRKWGSKEGTI